MANRSYLYSIDFDRTQKERDKEKIFGLSECNYSLPLSYQILASQDSKVSLSINWEYEQPIAIQGDFEKGKQKLLSFLDELSKTDLFELSELQEKIDNTKKFLNEHALKYIILECGELYELMEEDLELEEFNQRLYESEILLIDDQIKTVIDHLKEIKSHIAQLEEDIAVISKPKGLLAMLFKSRFKKGIDELQRQISHHKEEMWRLVGIDYWSDILYFHFDND